MKNVNSGVVSAAAMLVSLAVGSACADVIVNDNFTGSSGSGVATVSNAESSGVGTYRTIQGANGMTVTTLSGFGNGNVLSFANGTQTYYREFNGATTLTLSGLNVNDVLSLAYDVRYVGSFAGADNFSFGFVSSNPANSILYANLDLSSTGGTPSDFRYRTGSFNMSDAGIFVGSTFTEPSTVSATNYKLTLSVTRTAGGYDISYFRDASLIGSTTQTNGSTFANAVGGLSISGIAFRHSQTPSVVTYIDNVTVTVVPEPMTGVLMLCSGALLLVFRRRRFAT